jgi:hypothetical protein
MSVSAGADGGLAKVVVRPLQLIKTRVSLRPAVMAGLNGHHISPCDRIRLDMTADESARELVIGHHEPSGDHLG